MGMCDLNKKFAERPPTGCAQQSEIFARQEYKPFRPTTSLSGILVWIGVDNKVPEMGHNLPYHRSR